MARFNTALTSASITGTATIGSPNAGSFTNLTGTAPYTVTVPNPQLHPGVNQVFYNATSGTVTLTTPSGNFNGTGGNGTASISVFAGNVVSITSDGTHYIVISEDGSALTATTGSFSGNVTMNGSGATVSITPSTLTMAPTGASTIDSVAIGSTTRAAGAFTSLAANAAVTLTANTASSSTGTGTLVVTGGIGASGQVTATAVSATNLTGTLQTAAQTNITSLGTLTGLTINSGGGAGGISIGTDAGRALYQYVNFGGGNGGVDYAWQIGRSPSGGVGPADGFYFYDIKANETRLSINGSGNVGIRTANPSWPLTVKSGSSGTVATFLYDGAFAGTGEANIGLRWYNGGNASDIPQVKLRGYGTSNYTGNFGIDVLVGGTYPNGFEERFTIQGTTGNVGIGTTNPTAKLHVKGTAGNADPFINFEVVSPNSTFNWVSQSMASNLTGGNNLAHFIGKASSTKNSAYFAYKHSSDGSNDNILTLGLYGVDNVLNINGLANVGIGTTNPATKLDVAGPVNASGGILANGENFEKYLGNVYFTNGVANQAINVQFGNNPLGGLFEITISSSYSNQNAAGGIKKIFSVLCNPSNAIYGYESRVTESIGPIANNFAIDEFQWSGTQYVIPISHVVSSGNAVYVHLKVYGMGNTYYVYNNVTLSASYTLTALNRNYEYFNSPVGFGTTSPTTPLQVNGTIKSYASSVSNSNFLLRNSTTGDAAGFGLQQDGVNTYLYNNSNGLMAFATNAIERIRITSAGAVGIGLDGGDPDAKFHVKMTRTSSTSGIVMLLSDNVTGGQTNGVYKAIRSASNSGSSVSEIRFIETDGTNNNTAIAFATAPTAGGLAERMRVLPNGKINSGGVSEYYTAGETLGNQSFYIDIPVENDNPGLANTYHIQCSFSHANWSTYGCLLHTWANYRGSGSFAEQYDIRRIDGSVGGSWTVSKPNTGTIRITKNAGTYGGNGPYWIRVTMAA